MALLRAGDIVSAERVPSRSQADGERRYRQALYARSPADIDAVVAGLRARGAEPVGELQRYEDSYQLCHVRDPEGRIGLRHAIARLCVAGLEGGRGSLGEGGRRRRVVREWAHAGSRVPPGYTLVAWSASGRDVFITGGERFRARTIAAYRLGVAPARVLRVAVGDFYDIPAL